MLKCSIFFIKFKEIILWKKKYSILLICRTWSLKDKFKFVYVFHKNLRKCFVKTNECIFLILLICRTWSLRDKFKSIVTPTNLQELVYLNLSSHRNKKKYIEFKSNWGLRAEPSAGGQAPPPTKTGVYGGRTVCISLGGKTPKKYIRSKIFFKKHAKILFL